MGNGKKAIFGKKQEQKQEEKKIWRRPALLTRYTIGYPLDDALQLCGPLRVAVHGGGQLILLQWVPLRWSASGPAKIDHVSGMTIYPGHLQPRHWVPWKPPTSHPERTLGQISAKCWWILLKFGSSESSHRRQSCPHSVNSLQGHPQPRKPASMTSKIDHVSGI